ANVPIWVTVFTALMGALGLIVGLAALFDPSLFFFTDADEALGQRWAGRMIGLGIVTTGAVILRSRPIYILALLAGIAREAGDLAAASTDGDTTVPAIVTMLIGIAALAHIARTPTTTTANIIEPTQDRVG
ncbi:MAG: hypothetical protein AAFP84_20030, partial [Actinomycetota bacterium]